MRKWWMLALLVLGALAHAQTYTVLHNFTRHADGGVPLAGLTMDRFGNLFGTASEGGLPSACNYTGCGTVFELTRKGSGWLFTPLYGFTGYSDGDLPVSRVTIGTNGTLYGTTLYGGMIGGVSGAGVVFNLQPQPRVSGRVFGSWRETVIYAFGQPPDGANPWGDIAFDAQGNLYGTTFGGGIQCAGPYYCGTVYELTPHTGSWIESILYTFTQQFFSKPRDGVILDVSGNLYGTASNGDGQVFQLTHSGSMWLENTIYSFLGGSDASVPAGNVIFDPSGNLYGTTVYGGTYGQGAIYELTRDGGGWTERVLYSLGADGGSQPMAGLARDSAGNLYGVTCYGGASNRGAVFKLTPSGGGLWSETTLHGFTGMDGG